MVSTRIEWAGEVWNPVTGCSKVSEGCRHCYAERMARKLAGRFGYPRTEPFRVVIHPDRLDDNKSPFSVKRPSMIFVGSMTDLFHQDVPDTFLLDIFHLLRECDWHTFLILTKRPERMRDFMQTNDIIPHLLFGVSVEDQPAADKRVPILLETRAAGRFVSYEPALGPANFSPYLASLDWVIAGGETGLGARPAHPDWFRSVRDQCVRAGVPFFFKQWGEWYPGSMVYPAVKSNDEMVWVGHRAAGRWLDGRTWDELPVR